jgi:hypothetical protein
MDKTKYLKPKKYTPVEQYVFLNKSLTINGEGSVLKNVLTWIFKAQPTPFSRIYTIRIEFNGRSPKVYVIDPKITEIARGRKIPHLYNQEKQQLCLYYPKYGEWTTYKKISNTIVLWAFLWLYYFEIWVLTDKWEGGGKEPEPKKKTRKKRILSSHNSQ